MMAALNMNSLSQVSAYIDGAYRVRWPLVSYFKKAWEMKTKVFIRII